MGMRPGHDRGIDMTNRITRTALAAAALAAGAVLAGGGLAATAAPAAPAAGTAVPGSDVVRHDVPQQRAAAADYWTDERLESAVPLDVEVDATTLASARGTAPSDAAVVEIAAQAPAPAPQLRANQEAPIAHVGKVFFTGADGGTYVCSGNSVAAGNQNTVATAGHCVNDGAGTFFSNWVFIPAYERGSRPFGDWSARTFFTTGQWNQGGDFNHDAAFVVVNSPSGQSLSATVGGSGLVFNGDRFPQSSAFGYPAGAPFDGETLQSCRNQGTYQGDTATTGMQCDMTGGSSGGPWFQGDGSGGSQVSVNSYKLVGDPNQMFGPYFGGSILDAYDAAANA
jgi:V8-like Glu-specific endopeptidase